MKKIMLIGSVGSGKTTLCQRIQGESIKYKKTQSVEFYPQMIDTPGEFVLHRRFYSALQMMAASSDIIGFVCSVTELGQTFSPHFAQNFTKPCIGIITKIDLAPNEDAIINAEKRLELAGVEKIFRLSAVEDKGVAELITYLSKEKEG
ncbi:EutP/PduV family microcompartment system protein [Alkaliphilus sp. MSJ-5]|uniref:EutP/PduV family microcompartment system protein n=1 Tax=Alkaliphilus flagellatus TaxID=2841507 RepID=A0ABS6FXU5_9FIRM|nr:EutP/PduV family microcompartment system protein [Alkaliphilus flagellatus]MBU5675042.1 EutP/PduV family microcompartment system protein [Alkaliphilus flagellatus]